MAILLSDSNAAKGSARLRIKDCCKRKTNRININHNGQDIDVCKICGARHFTMHADPIRMRKRF